MLSSSARPLVCTVYRGFDVAHALLRAAATLMSLPLDHENCECRQERAMIPAGMSLAPQTFCPAQSDGHGFWWRTHSCVRRRHSWRRLRIPSSPRQRHECRCGTQECVRHVDPPVSTETCDEVCGDCRHGTWEYVRHQNPTGLWCLPLMPTRRGSVKSRVPRSQSSVPVPRLLALALMTLPLLASAAPQDRCSTSTNINARNLQQQVKAGPFYQSLQREFGQPLTCTLEIKGSAIGLTYTFRNRARLTARIDSQIETSEQRLQTPRMDQAKAVTLLKAAEKYAYAPNGCGIAWDQPEDSPGAAGSSEAIYRGDTCNCQARVTLKNHFAVLLILKSAC